MAFNRRRRLYRYLTIKIALHKAAFMDQFSLITLLIEEFKKRTDVNLPTDLIKWVNMQSEQGYTALHYASYRGNIDVIKILIESGANLNITNKRGLNVFHMSAQGNQPTSLVYFREKYNFDLHSIDDMGSTALHWACYTGSENAVIFILSYSPKLNIQDKEGFTALHLAVMSGIVY
jgi:ankyrin repeat protein